jgi:hypothetical protein
MATLGGGVRGFFVVFRFHHLLYCYLHLRVVVIVLVLGYFGLGLGQV